MLVALALAALVNADALVERAERKPLGPGRDRSLAIWHPVQDVAHVTQISRLRDLGDWLAGNEDEGGSGVPLAVRARRTTVPPDAVRPDAAGADRRRTRCASTSAATRSSATPATPFLEPRQRQPRCSTRRSTTRTPPGLTRPDFYDWPAALARGHGRRTGPRWRSSCSAATTPRGSSGPTARRSAGPSDPRWQAEYARRVGGRDGHPPGRRPHRATGSALPPMRDDGFDGRAEHHERDLPRGGREPAVDDLPRHRPDLRRRRRATTSSASPTASGDLVDLRQEDGVHLSQPGADPLAREHARPDRRGDPGGPRRDRGRRRRPQGLAAQPRSRSCTASS